MKAYHGNYKIDLSVVWHWLLVYEENARFDARHGCFHACIDTHVHIKSEGEIDREERSRVVSVEKRIWDGFIVVKGGGVAFDVKKTRDSYF